MFYLLGRVFNGLNCILCTYIVLTSAYSSPSLPTSSRLCSARPSTEMLDSSSQTVLPPLLAKREMHIDGFIRQLCDMMKLTPSYISAGEIDAEELALALQDRQTADLLVIDDPDLISSAAEMLKEVIDPFLLLFHILFIHAYICGMFYSSRFFHAAGCWLLLPGKGCIHHEWSFTYRLYSKAGIYVRPVAPLSSRDSPGVHSKPRFSYRFSNRNSEYSKCDTAPLVMALSICRRHSSQLLACFPVFVAIPLRKILF